LLEKSPQGGFFLPCSSFWVRCEKKDISRRVAMELCPFWTEKDHRALLMARDFRSAGVIALEVLARVARVSDGEVVQVCGPITSGGLGCREKNFAVFKSAVVHLRSARRLVFDQTPLEIILVPLWQEWSRSAPPGAYCWELLEEVYRPILESRMVTTLVFIPGWDQSLGSRWERALGYELGLCIEEFPEEVHHHIRRKHA